MEVKLFSSMIMQERINAGDQPDRGKQNKGRGKGMGKEQYHAAKAQLVICMQEGQAWHAAAAAAGLQISQSNAYRLWRAARQRGENAMGDESLARGSR